MESKPIKLVVVNENTLGYIESWAPTMLTVFRSYITVKPSSRFDDRRGAQLLWDSDVIRLASQKDFDYFRVSMEGYIRDGRFDYLIDTSPIDNTKLSIEDQLRIETRDSFHKDQLNKSSVQYVIPDPWKPVTEKEPAECVEVIGFHKDWINEDFNIPGTRVCFRNEGDWTCAEYSNSADGYNSVSTWEENLDCQPSHFMEIPSTKHLI